MKKNNRTNGDIMGKSTDKKVHWQQDIPPSDAVCTKKSCLIELKNLWGEIGSLKATIEKQLLLGKK